MSIDGIGKRGGGVLPAGASPVDTASVPGSAFELAASGVAATPSAALGGSAELAALERGELGVEQYLEARVESAVAPLLSLVSPEQLEFVRAELRSALETDPVLVELVRKATGGSAGVG